MRLVGIQLWAAALLAFCPVWQVNSAETPAPGAAPDFQEVYDLIRNHLAGVSDSNLNQTAVSALVSALAPRVTVVAGDKLSPERAGGPLVKTAKVLDGTTAYLAVSRVEEGLVNAVREAYQGFGTNKLNGLVLDLRYAGGDDYGAAADTADLFLSKERALLNWGTGLVQSKEKRDAITMPVAVLVNGQTARAAEALAAVLREAGVALLLGGKTAGQAMIAQEYPLKNGQRLRIATASIQVGESLLLSAQGVKPDILVEVSSTDERAYFADAYKELSPTNLPISGSVSNGLPNGTNRMRRSRLNEAELVRERREGFMTEFDPSSARPEAEAEKPMVRDPVLARALDLLKGLAVVKQSRSSLPR